VEHVPEKLALSRAPSEVQDKEGHRIDVRPVRDLLASMIARWRPEQIWLFGSRARGAARADSDWDFLVVVPDETPDQELDPLLAWGLQREAHVAADIVPCRSADFDEFQNTPNTLFFEVSKSGVVVYER
jgi:uncharacterized protein